MIKRLPIFLFLAVILLHQKLFYTQIILSFDSYIINDDQRHLAVLFSFFDSSLFKGDYLTNYYLHTMLPSAYLLLFKFFSVVATPEILINLIPLICWAITLIFACKTSYKLGNVYTALATLILLLSTDIFLDRLVGGLSRSFAYPFMAMALYALSTGNIFFLAILTILGTAFYPVIGTISGLTLAVYVLLIPQRYKTGPTWKISKNVIVLATTAVLSISGLLPMLVGSMEYGQRATDPIAYPEIGEGGRNNNTGRPPYDGFVSGSLKLLGKTIFGNASILQHQPPALAVFILILFTVLCVIGYLRLLKKSAMAMRLSAYILAAFIGHSLSIILAPYFYHPERYLLFTIPLFFVVIFPAALQALLAEIAMTTNRRKAPGWLSALIIFLFSSLLSGQLPASGYVYHVDSNTYGNVFRFISNTPKSSVIAGWPNHDSIIDNVPYFGKRTALLTYELHIPYHTLYLKEMRKRMVALMDAYFAKDSTPLKTLRDTYGVTHFIVEKKHFKETPPTYFKPFDEEVPSRLAAVIENPYILSDSLKQKAAVYEDDVAVIYELSKLEE